MPLEKRLLYGAPAQDSLVSVGHSHLASPTSRNSLGGTQRVSQRVRPFLVFVVSIRDTAGEQCQCSCRSLVFDYKVFQPENMCLHCSVDSGLVP